MGRAAAHIPDGMRLLHGPSHDGGSSIPVDRRFRIHCGAAAVGMAREHGVFRTAKALKAGNTAISSG